MGVFLIGNTLCMFHVQAVFRFFSFEQPVFVRRLIRKISKQGGEALTPLFLGALTVLIPSLNIQAMLPVDGQVVFDIPAQPAASRLFYCCSMGLYGSVITLNSSSFESG